MITNLLVGFALVLVVGTLMQWVAWLIHVPSILLLLIAGITLGPIFGLLNPDALFGATLFPLVSLSVAIILFEGGLSLKFSAAKQVALPIIGLITVGLLATWAIGSSAAHFILGLDFSLSVLIGAVLTVSGPTVVVPLLRYLRVKSDLNSILKWEGILIDPIGALLSVLIFEALLSHQGDLSSQFVAFGWISTALIGSLIGIVSGVIISQGLKRYLIPDYLVNPLTLCAVVASFASAEILHHESGLFAVTVMGIYLANATVAHMHTLLEFKEDLRVLLISCLFVVLSARLDSTFIESFDFSSFLFVAAVVVIGRPVAVFISTIGSKLTLKDKAFLSLVAPRGIVAAAVSSLFALELEAANIPGASSIATYTFMVILGSIIYSSVFAPIGARLLGVKQRPPQGVLILGANAVGIMIAEELRKNEIDVLLVDTNWHHISAAKKLGLQCKLGNILSESVVGENDLDGLGKYFGLTANSEANILGGVRFKEFFGSSEIYHLNDASRFRKDSIDSISHLQGRTLFSGDCSFDFLESLVENGAATRSTQLTPQFSFADFKEKYPDSLPLFLIQTDGKLLPITTDKKLAPPESCKLISLHPAVNKT